MLNPSWIPTVAMKSPAAAIVNDEQKIVIISPRTVRHIQATISSLRPNRSPITAEMRKPTTPPTYIRVSTKSSLIFSESQRQSPKWLARLVIDLSGMNGLLASGVSPHTCQRQSLMLSGQVQGSWKKRKGIMSISPPQTYPMMHQRTVCIFWQRPMEPTFSIREKNTLSSTFWCSMATFSEDSSWWTNSELSISTIFKVNLLHVASEHEDDKCSI